ncbi:hypothetical protein C4D60_Mb01t05550 [Musa balbisiana]|uniref:Uncharacterized protein n=1 Tax=Musa balbisiana TaxID=52838 RepID=A0A4V4H757_MUSBA|nr:hypothetical protein C4D60_Mb01t05550 [Musa balbisiana]
MAVALVNPRAPAGRAIGLLLRSLDTIRSVSVVPSPSSMNAEDPKKKKNLFGVAQFLPNWGIGYKMAKTHWRDASFEIAKVYQLQMFCWVKTPKADCLFSVLQMFLPRWMRNQKEETLQ